MTKLNHGKPPLIGKMPKSLIDPLARLARCQTAQQALSVLATIPAKWLPLVAEYMANRPFYRPAIVRAALMAAGLKNLERDLGPGRTKAIIANYLDTDESHLQERFFHATHPGFTAYLDKLQRFDDLGVLHCCGDQERR